MGKDHLPRMAKRLINLIGFEATHLLIKNFGGIMLPIGKGIRNSGISRYESIAEVIGHAAMKRLSQEFNGQHLSVPRCFQFFINHRDMEIIEAHKNQSGAIGKHKSAGMLAQKYNLTQREIYSILAKNKSIVDREECLSLCTEISHLDNERLNAALINYARKKGGFFSELIDIVGAEEFVELVKIFGGRTLSIPALKREEGLVVYEKIADAVGYKAASNLAKNYAGEVVAIPRAYRALKLGRNIEILKEFESMLGYGSATTVVEELARKYKLTTRQVWSILKKPLSIH